ncbi:MAG: CRISPR system precrRNA processing endoribonuclease RAMP protein Cas6 [Nitrospirae bacterium]|nr:CRISPR system precrRNA processing endoribonuclease RAMP protein Cas6 [Nitrospirota bacterium]
MRIPYNRFSLILQAEEEITLPAYKGATLRGAFGVAFKRIVCALRKEDCSECLLSGRCIYFQIFEARAEGENPLGRVKTIPKPFVIDPPDDEKNLFVQGEALKFTLTLIGKATEYIPYFIYTFDELGRMGIGRKRGRYILREVIDLDSNTTVYNHDRKILEAVERKTIDLSEAIEDFIHPAVKDNDTELTVRAVTPIRIKYGRHYTAELEFHILIRQLLRRLFLLWYFHGDYDSEYYETIREYHKNAIRLAEKVRTKKASLYWYDWERYSTRQKARMKLGGVLGSVTYAGPVEPFNAFLKAGEIFHVGKGTTFGLGKYILI